jgi:hypothetical protein
MERVRFKFRVVVVLWFLLGSAFLIMSMYISNYFIIPLLLVTAMLGMYSLSLRCPNCGKPVLHNHIEIFGIDFYIWTSWIPKKCKKCGVEL